ncbi:hypothetical protein N9B23_00970, partial [bacterium]|nr:hypothetical protein [bacterium]
ADLLMSAESPVRNQEVFQSFIDEHDRATARRIEVEELDGKLVEEIAGIERAETKAVEKQKQLAAEKKVLAGFAGELGKAAFAGLQAGKLQDHLLFADRKVLQSQIDALKQQQAELVASKDSGLLDKAKRQAQHLKIAGQIKIEELKTTSSNKSLGVELLRSQEEVSVRCHHTEEVLEAISRQRSQVEAAQDTSTLADEALTHRKSVAAETLVRPNVIDSASLKSELKEVRKEHRQTEKAIAELRKSVVAKAMEMKSLRDDEFVGEKLKELWSLNFDLESSQPQVIKLATEGLPRFKGLPPKYKYGFYGGAGVAILLLAMLVIGGGDTDDSLPDGKEATAEVKDEEAQVNDEEAATTASGTFRYTYLGRAYTGAIESFGEKEDLQEGIYVDAAKTGWPIYMCLDSVTLFGLGVTGDRLQTGFERGYDKDGIAMSISCFIGNYPTLEPFDPKHTPRLSLSIEYYAGDPSEDGSRWYGKPASKIPTSRKRAVLRAGNKDLIDFGTPLKSNGATAWDHYKIVQGAKQLALIRRHIGDPNLRFVIGNASLEIDDETRRSLLLFDRAVATQRYRRGSRDTETRQTLGD